VQASTILSDLQGTGGPFFFLCGEYRGNISFLGAMDEGSLLLEEYRQSSALVRSTLTQVLALRTTARARRKASGSIVIDDACFEGEASLLLLLLCWRVAS
jgi:hypothetical protein